MVAGSGLGIALLDSDRALGRRPLTPVPWPLSCAGPRAVAGRSGLVGGDVALIAVVLRALLYEVNCDRFAGGDGNRLREIYPKRIALDLDGALNNLAGNDRVYRYR